MKPRAVELTEYRLLEEYCNVRLGEQVSCHLRQGWTLYGEPRSEYNPINQRFFHFQAVVR